MTAAARIDEALLPRGRDVIRTLSRTLAALAMGLTVVFAVVQFLPALSVPRDSAFAEVAFVLAFVVQAAVGTLIAWHRPGNAVGWLLLAMGFAVVLTGALTTYAYRGLVTESGSLPAASWARWAQSWLFLPAWFGGLTLPLFLLPDGRLPSRRWRPVFYATLGALFLATVVEALRPGPIGETVPIDNPVGLTGWEGLLEVAEAGSLAVLALGAAAGLVSLLVRWRDASGRVRHQMAWLVAGAAVFLTLLCASYVVSALGAPEVVSALLSALALATPGVAVGLAVLRSRLLDIEIVASHTVVWAGISVLAVLTYAVALTATTRWASGEVGTALSILATATVALGLGALRQWTEPRLRTRLFGYRDRPYELLTGLGETLTSRPMTDPGTTIAAWLRRHLGLAYAAVEYPTDVPGAQEPVNAVRFPLELEGRRLGHLVVAPIGGTILSAKDRQVVEHVARQASLAVLAQHLSAEVQRSRADLVRAREQERLRIRRDVHDGIGPTLAAVPLQLDAIAARLGDDDGAARAITFRVKEEVRSAVADLRLLIDGLRPANLDHFGLAGAVEQRAVAVRDAGVHVDLDLDPAVDRLGAAAEVVVLHVVSEALANVVRHARAEHAEVRVGIDDGAVRVDVLDDGDGPPKPLRAGVGLESMRARVTELEGTLELSRGPLGGFRVLATIPLEDA